MDVPSIMLSYDYIFQVVFFTLYYVCKQASDLHWSRWCIRTMEL